jgi:hypothetical protein
MIPESEILYLLIKLFAHPEATSSISIDEQLAFN